MTRMFDKPTHAGPHASIPYSVVENVSHNQRGRRSSETHEVGPILFLGGDSMLLGYHPTVGAILLVVFPRPRLLSLAR